MHRKQLMMYGREGFIYVLKLARCPHSLAASLAVLPSMSLIPSSSIVLIRGNHEPVNRLALNESIPNLQNVRAWNKKGNRKTSSAGRLDARMHYWPRLAGGTIPFIRRYSTICP
jgi:hypothetical protein